MLNKDPVFWFFFFLYYCFYCFISIPCPSAIFCDTSAVMRWVGEQPLELTPAGLEDWQTLNSPSIYHVID